MNKLNTILQPIAFNGEIKFRMKIKSAPESNKSHRNHWITESNKLWSHLETGRVQELRNYYLWLLNRSYTVIQGLWVEPQLSRAEPQQGRAEPRRITYWAVHCSRTYNWSGLAQQQQTARINYITLHRMEVAAWLDNENKKGRLNICHNITYTCHDQMTSCFNDVIRWLNDVMPWYIYHVMTSHDMTGTWNTNTVHKRSYENWAEETTHTISSLTTPCKCMENVSRLTGRSTLSFKIIGCFYQVAPDILLHHIRIQSITVT
jgi:hypothetical protein